MDRGQIQAFFRHYQQLTTTVLSSSPSHPLPTPGFASLYASSIVASGPLGILTRDNDASFLLLIEQKILRDRESGQTGTELRVLNIFDVDDMHCVARVEWIALFDEHPQSSASSQPVSGRSDMTAPVRRVSTEVSYLLKSCQGEIKILGWMSSGSPSPTFQGATAVWTQWRGGRRMSEEVMTSIEGD